MTEAAYFNVERLQEYRTALITAAVTVKIDVRGTAHAKADAASSAVQRVRDDITCAAKS